MNEDLTKQFITRDIATKTSQPIYLTSVEVNGGDHFSNDFFKKLLNPLIETSDFTIGQLIDSVNSSYNKLSLIGVFDDISIKIMEDNRAELPINQPNFKNYTSVRDNIIKTKILFDLKSNNLNVGELKFKVNNENPLNVSLNYLNNNFNSNGEILNVQVNYNPYKPIQHLISNAKLITNFTNPNFKFLIGFENNQENNQIWQQASQKSIGGILGVQYYNHLKKFKILNGLSIVKRTLHDINEAALDDVKVFGGDSIKSLIINQVNYGKFQYLNNETKNFPTYGFNINLKNEISSNQENFNGEQPSKLFTKSSISSKLIYSIFNNFLTFNLGQDFGLIYNPLLIPIHPSDKFYLGGFDSFKGFSKNSINLNGGDQFYKFDFYVFSKLPSFIYSPLKPNDNPLRLYSNFIVGNVSNDILSDNNSSNSVGFGVKYFNNWCNFDIGYYFAKSSNVGINDGLQFSFEIGGSNKV